MTYVLAIAEEPPLLGVTFVVGGTCAKPPSGARLWTMELEAADGLDAANAAWSILDATGYKDITVRGEPWQLGKNDCSYCGTGPCHGPLTARGDDVERNDRAHQRSYNGRPRR